MASFNKVVLLGNLTREPKLVANTSLAEFGLAVNDRIKRNGEWVDDVCFIDVTVFGRTAEVVQQYLHKGSSVLVEGKLKLDSWEKDGQKRSKHKIIGDRIVMTGGKAEGGGQAKSQPATQQHITEPDDLTPF